MKSTASDSFLVKVQQAIDWIKEGDNASIGGLYDLTAQRLVRLAVVITGNQPDAEDAIQASFARISQSSASLLRSDQPWHYLLKMVRNDALLIIRRRKPTEQLYLVQELCGHCPVDQIALAETYHAVWEAMRRLPPEQSEVVALKIWEQMTFFQISEVLEIPVATAASRYRYALDKLEVILRDHKGQVVHVK
jgi:RNA polymerase sigma-70 factor (ECF subfamily)